MKLAKLMLHPVRLRILQYVRLRGSACTGEIVEYLADVPRATVYHHVKLLEANSLLQVIRENRVRGTVEKVYASRQKELPVEGETGAALATAFHLGLMREFEQYFSGPNQDVKRDNIHFSTALLQVTEEEYQQLLQSIAQLLLPYVGGEPQAGRSLRKLSIISSPPAKPSQESELV